jgi:hypothetical protein
LLRLRLIMRYQWLFSQSIRMKIKINLQKLVFHLILYLRSLRILMKIWWSSSNHSMMLLIMRS